MLSTTNKIHLSPNTHKMPSSPNSSKKLLNFQSNNTNKKSKSKSRSKPMIINNLVGHVPKSFH